MIDKHQINAIIEDDLPKIIDQLQLSHKINKGEINCCNCDKPITISNISLIKIVEGEIQFLCDSDYCTNSNEPKL